MEPRVFTRDDPCTKWEIWHCFRVAAGFTRRLLVEAEAEIGQNAPKYLRRKEYMRLVQTPREDFYELTKEGEEWLLKGFQNYLKANPEKRSGAKFIPDGWYPARVTRVKFIKPRK